MLTEIALATQEVAGSSSALVLAVSITLAIALAISVQVSLATRYVSVLAAEG